MFKYYRSITLAVLTGFILGSLNKIWPWRNPLEFLKDEAGNIIMEDGLPKKILTEANVIPSAYDGEPFVIWAVIAAVIGFAIVFLLEKFGGQD